MSKFKPGQFVATPGALAALEESGQEPTFFLAKHLAGDWGQLDQEDWLANDQSVTNGSRIISAYKTLKGKKIWVITEAVGDDGNRAATTILLPSEY